MLREPENHRHTARRIVLGLTLAGSAVALVSTGAAIGEAGEAGQAGAGRRARMPSPARLASVSAPLGTQGRAGAGEDVVIPFRIIDATRFLADIEAQYGIDRNGDGAITDDEYAPARENRIDRRNTRRNLSPQLFATAAGAGATHAFVWRSDADLPLGRFYTSDYVVTPEGRLFADPDRPGQFLHSPLAAGVRVRLRATKALGGRKFVGPWVTSEAFSLQNATPPSLRVTAVEPSAEKGADGLSTSMTIRWTGIHPDSEDFDGDGVLDVIDGEDRNGNGVLDTRRLGVSFDSHPVRPGENPATMTRLQLESLDWHPCPRRVVDGVAVGDEDSVSGAPVGRAVSGTPDGLPWTFVWDAENDGHAQGKGPYILRARVVDESGARSEDIYLLSGVTR